MRLAKISAAAKCMSATLLLSTSMAQSAPVIHCVSTKDQLLAAFQDVKASGLTADQEIRLQAGTYDFGNAGGFDVPVDSGGGPIQFTLEGGFDPGDTLCAAKSQLGAQHTTIANYTAIGIKNAGNITIRDLSFTVPETSANPTAFIQSASLTTIDRVVMRGGLANDTDHLDVYGKDVLVTNTLVYTSGTTIGCSLRVGHWPDAAHSGGSLVVHHATVAAPIQTRGICPTNSDALAAVEARVSNSITLTSAGYDIENSVFGTVPAILQSDVYHRLHQFTSNILAPQINNTIDAGFEVFTDIAQGDLSPSQTMANNPVIGTADPNVLPVLTSDVYGNPRLSAKLDRGAVAAVAENPKVLVFTIQPTNVSQGDMLGTVQVMEKDSVTGDTIDDSTSNVDFTIVGCGGRTELDNVPMNNGVATLDSTLRLYTVTGGNTLSIGAVTAVLDASSENFSVDANQSIIFNSGFESCRL